MAVVFQQSKFWGQYLNHDSICTASFEKQSFHYPKHHPVHCGLRHATKDWDHERASGEDESWRNRMRAEFGSPQRIPRPQQNCVQSLGCQTEAKLQMQSMQSFSSFPELSFTIFTSLDRLVPVHLRRHDRTMWRCDLGFPVSSRSKGVVNLWLIYDFNIFQYDFEWKCHNFQRWRCWCSFRHLIRMIPSFGDLAHQVLKIEIHRFPTWPTCPTCHSLKGTAFPAAHRLTWPNKNPQLALDTGRPIWREISKKAKKLKRHCMDQNMALEALHPAILPNLFYNLIGDFSAWFVDL